MHLLYSGHTIDEGAFKRLLLVANHITFIEDQRFQFDNILLCGTSEKGMRLRDYYTSFSGGPVNISIQYPMDYGSDEVLYDKYITLDLKNPDFIGTILDANIHTWKMSGRECSDQIKWVIANYHTICHADYCNMGYFPDRDAPAGSEDSKFLQVKLEVIFLSLKVTAILRACGSTDVHPVSTDQFLDKLISIRLSYPGYVTEGVSASNLGLKLMECIICDEAIDKIPTEEILEFRLKTKEYFDAWLAEIRKLEVILVHQGSLFRKKDIVELIDTDLAPKIVGLKNEIKAIRDERFRDILKMVKNSALSALTFGGLSSISIPAAIAGVIASNLTTPKLTDAIIDSHFKKREKELQSSVSYLLKIQQLQTKRLQ